MNAVRTSRAGCCAALTAVLLLWGNQNLENAVANGDTRTLSLHHIHTDEDITITYKRNGRYDEEALKKLDRFVRDWRKEEEIHMDPQLFDLIWEVSREVAGDSTIHVVCGYRSPATNAMLRRRSSGVAKFSQHTLGKAMDFYIPGASLEALRVAGLRLQRGGVGYYPSSGSPFVHLDVGGVRYWPRMSREELARVFPDGRTVYLPADGRPLSGYALALADIEKRNAGTARVASFETPAGQNAGPRKKNLLAALFSKDEEEDAEAAKGAPAAPPAVAPVATRRAGFALASVDAAPDAARPAAALPVPVPTARPARFAAAADTAPQAAPQAKFALASAEPPRIVERAKAPPRAVPADADVTGSTATGSAMSWPLHEADNDRVPLDMVMAYAEQPHADQVAPAPRPQPMGATVSRGVAPAAKASNPVDNVTTVTKKSSVRAAVSGDGVQRAKAVIVIANAGMRYDDPWLRAMILAPSLADSMTATLYGDPDMTELRALMNKPAMSVAMSFDEDPYPGISAAHFSGDAVVFLNTFAFQRRTAWLR